MIENLTLDRLPEILPLFRQVQMLHADHLPHRFRADWDETAALEHVEKALRDGATCLVAKGGDGQALGYLIYVVQLSSATPLKQEERFALLDVISVDERAQRQGIGRALITAMKARLKTEGITRWRVTHHAFNDASAALMASEGAEPIIYVREGKI